MKTYQYTDESNTVVHVIDDDGVSRSSCAVSAIADWLNGYTETIRAPGTYTPEVPATFDAEGVELTPAVPSFYTEGEILETIVHEPHTPEPYVPPAIDLQALTLELTQLRLDTFAKTRNYDGILSACTYATDPNPLFAAEGQRAVDLRSSTWASLYSLIAEVQAGTKPAPTSYEEIEAILPVLSWE